MRIISEKLINNVLFEAQMGSLNRHAYICIPPLETYSNRGSYNESYIRQPTYHQSVQIPENLSNPNEPSCPTPQRIANLEETGTSIGQYFESYQ
ncbi:hypothetical protein RI129_002736 [Pyrocoelia pectoralis]|uniref:Uncharacterized protein n=1 Tax=Pyrocoelia pectoralis TaxID=417401 RepID=A0AAN7VJY8_9COLE